MWPVCGKENDGRKGNHEKCLFPKDQAKQRILMKGFFIQNF
jgi:hypothetical protein